MSPANVEDKIIAIVALKKDSSKVDGGVPMFFVEDREKLEEISMLLARITLGMVHDLGNGVKVIIRH
ncbi:MAG: capping complex subunit for YIEGIA [Halanaerobiaceae bacterium]